MKENKNAFNDDVTTFVLHVPLLLDDMLEDVQNNDESKCHCGCSCCVDSNEDDVNIDDLIGDLTSFDELLNSLLNDEHNNPSEKNEEYKPSKKEKKMLVDSPVNVTKNNKCYENKIITASELRKKQKSNSNINEAVDKIIKGIDTQLVYVAVHTNENKLVVWLDSINFPSVFMLTNKELNEVIVKVVDQLNKVGYETEIEKDKKIITIKW